MFDAFMTWIVDSKEWLFSGIGVAIITLIGRFLYKQRQTSLSQTIKSGDKSTNLQAGGNVNLSTMPKGNEVEKE